jgi:opacity protein-like surface antigen
MTHYFTSEDFKNANSGKKNFADMGLTGTIVHSFNSRCTYSAALNISYSPEPDYSTGISAARRQGECFNWAFNNSYSQAIDARWSWDINAGYSGVLYSETEYQSDDRQYWTAGAGLVYRSSELLSYNIRFSYKNDQRDYGYNSDNMTVMVGFDRALDPVSSCSASIGVQQKFVHSKQILSPNIRLGYNRKAAEGFSVNSYALLSNENVDTYRGPNANYLSDLTLRVGVDGIYTLSPDVSFTFGISVMRSQYSEGTYGMDDETNTSYRPHVGMKYKFSQQLTVDIRYEYTYYQTDRKKGDYTRHVISTGFSYTF